MICLVGFMGAGKSTVLRELAERGLETADVDAVIEERTGMGIASIFAEQGEEAFRRIEEEVTLSLIDEARLDAIALGGGAVTSDRVRASLAEAETVTLWLDVTAEQAWGRVARSDRPLAQDRVEFEALFQEREWLYLEAADVVLPGGSTAGIEPVLDLVDRVGDLPDGTKLLWAAGGDGGYPIFVGPNLLGSRLLDADGPLLGALGGSTVIVSDEQVGKLHGTVLRGFGDQVTFPAGEGSKNMSTAEAILSQLARLGVSRGDHLLALGGGVVGDLAGFCAATYQRGIPVVQAPTSLVAQVDSAYGGKTGVDLPEGKNYVGAFHQPAAVVSDTTLLATLPEPELAAGMAEVIKTGLLAGGQLWNEIRGLRQGEILSRPDVVFGCARYKCQVVAQDERDSGMRAALNLGHTVGHAIETATGYSTYRHGEAVALGLLAALRLSGADDLRAEVAELNLRHGLPVLMDGAVDPAEVVRAVAFDKKKTAAGVGFVLLRTPGSPEVGCRVADGELVEAVSEIAG